jgi:hypothetical protein
MKNDYRKIWESHYGPIPKDENDRSYEIHHIDGNHTNNDIENLMCINIDEHYRIHYEQGDYGACHLIAKRMTNDPKELSRVISELNKKRVGDKNPFFGKKHSKETCELISKINSGENHPFYGKKRPEFAKKVSAALKGKPKSEEHKKALSEARMGKATKLVKYIMSKDDAQFEIVNLKQYCRDHNLPYYKIRVGIEYNGYKLVL